MIRTLAAFATIVGVLLMSMPGGLCFVLMGIGVEHHHHEVEDFTGAGCVHVHSHDHDDHGHSHEHDVPEVPCDPCDDNADLLANAGVLKIDPAALPLIADFKPEWVLIPERLGTDRFKAIDPSPPPVSVRFCCFLI